MSRQSAVNDFWWWEIKDQGLAKAICNKHNDTLAAWSRQHPDRFVGMASIPLQFPDMAADMLQDAVKRLGARGVAIGGHVNGESLSLPKYDVFWAKVAELGELAFMHPNGSANMHSTGRARRTRRAWKHRRQPARDDGLPVAPDLRRDVRQVPER